MTPDFRALARDVDRLWRGRESGATHPLGVYEFDWSARPAMCRWIPADAERRAMDAWRALEGKRPYSEEWAMTYATRYFVAMLAVTEPAHFRTWVAEADALLPEPTNADIVRTARFLARLSERWHDYRTSQAIGEAIRAAADAKASDLRERAEVDARTEAALAEDEDAFRDWAA